MEQAIFNLYSNEEGEKETSKLSKSGASSARGAKKFISRRKSAGRTGSFRRALLPSTRQNLKCKRSISLEDLPFSLEQDLTIRRQLVYKSECEGMSKSPKSEEEEWEYETINPNETKLMSVALRGYTAFLRNSWRKRKQEVTQHEQANGLLKDRVSNLNLQITTLKYFLKSDEQIVKCMTKENQTLKQRVDESAKEKETLITEKVGLHVRVERLEEEVERLRTDLKNEENRSRTAWSEVASYEVQLLREREKVNAAKKEKNSTLDKLESKEIESEKKDEKIKGLSFSLAKLEKEMEKQMELMKNINDKIITGETALNSSRDQINTLEKELKFIQTSHDNINMQTSSLSKALEEKEKSCAILENSCQRQLIKLVELQSQLEHNKNHVWVDKTIGTMRILLQIPLAFFEHIAFPHNQDFSPFNF